jgi:hypothetical protein
MGAEHQYNYGVQFRYTITIYTAILPFIVLVIQIYNYIMMIFYYMMSVYLYTKLV